MNIYSLCDRIRVWLGIFKNIIWNLQGRLQWVLLPLGWSRQSLWPCSRREPWLEASSSSSSAWVGRRLAEAARGQQVSANCLKTVADLVKIGTIISYFIVNLKNICPFPASHFIVLSFQYSWQLIKYLPMAGFELRISGVGSDHSTNWATTTGHVSLICFCKLHWLQNR